MTINKGCHICGENLTVLDGVDFNKACLEPRVLNPSGLMIYYFICDGCGFCFSPEIRGWSLCKFEKEIYNDDYIKFDPDYADERPRVNANYIKKMFGMHVDLIKHLDYGGGNGLLAKLLCEEGFQSMSFDPFVDKDLNLQTIGTFDLITAFEVFEHVPEPENLMKHLSGLIKPDGIIVFSTLFSDNNISKNERLTWWYASPRNGHISLFTRRSLGILAEQYGFKFVSVNNVSHVLFKTIPLWASNLIK